MNANLLELYLKLNLLFVTAFLLWLATKHLARLLRFEVSHARQLKVARLVFASLLIGVPLLLLSKYLLPEWIKGMVSAVSGSGIAQEVTFTAGMHYVLVNKYQLGLLTIEPKLLIVAFLLGGLLVQLGRLTLGIHKLRRITAEATQWKSLAGIQLLVSASITSPFSTRVLGSKQIVLPMQLLESPRNLQLAIKHELQHVRNGDLEWVILLELVNVLCFWNPAVWFWHNEFDCLQEFACDEVLVGERRVSSQAYGNCLLEVASSVSGHAMLASSNMVPKFSLWQDHKTQLKRRILMLMKMRNKKNSGLKTLCYSLLIGFGLADAAALVFAAEPGKSDVPVKASTNPNRDIVPITRVNPEYPAAGLSQKLEGAVTLRFTIDETGKVQDAEVIKSVICKDIRTFTECKDDDTFKQSALKALSRWQYNPKMENGVAVKREGIQTMLKFQLAD